MRDGLSRPGLGIVRGDEVLYLKGMAPRPHRPPVNAADALVLASVQQDDYRAAVLSGRGCLIDLDAHRDYITAPADPATLEPLTVPAA